MSRKVSFICIQAGYNMHTMVRDAINKSAVMIDVLSDSYN